MKRGADRIHIHDVALRDGLQIEPVFVPTADKVRLCNALSRTGLDKIEVTSFTSPKAIPALADAAEVMQRIERVPGVSYAALVPNTRGAERALICGVDEINLVMSASESHSQANLRMSPERSLQQFEDVLALVRQTPDAQVAFNASLSTAFGCPFDGDVPAQRVFDLIVAHVERHTPCGVTAHVQRNPGRADPFQMPAGHNAGAVAREVLAEVYGRAPYQTRLGGSIPVLTTLLDTLGVHAVMFGFSHDDENLHAPDEFFRLAVYRKGQTAYVRLLEKLGAAGG